MFVGREKEVGEAVDLSRSTEEATILAFVGMPGIGKSALLDEILHKTSESEGVICVPTIDLSTRPTAPQDAGQHTLASLWHTFERSRELMLEWAGWTGGVEDFAEFRRIARVAKMETEHLVRNEVSLTDKAKGAHISQTASMTLDAATVETTIRTWQTSMNDAFVDAWESWSARRRMLVAVDHFELIAGRQLGQWVMWMTLRLPHLVVVLACPPGTQSHFPDSDRIVVRHLRPFDAEEVRRYLVDRFDPLEVPDEVARVAYRFTTGHPGSVKLVADLMSERDTSRRDVGELRRLLDRLPEEPWAKWAALLELVLEPLKDEVLLRAAKASAVVNTFDAPLLAALVDEDATRVGDAIGVLHGYGLIRQVDAQSGRFRMREFLRRAQARHLRTKHSPSWEEFHRRAAAHFAETLDSMSDEQSDAYGTWYRYENPEWQRAKTEWLYHTSQLPASDELTRARFVIVFLEAFFWYGCYEPFLFNRRMLWDWTHASVDEDDAATVALPGDERDEQLLAALTFLLDQYPPGYVKRSEKWDEIRDKLLLIEGLCGLGRGGRLRATAEADEVARVGGLIRIFLAHTRRFRTPPSKDADRYYAEALAAFQALDDRWVVAWLLFETADLRLEQGKHHEAPDLLAEASGTLIELVATGEDWDEELVTNLWRARGDAHSGEGDVESAFACYAKALVHAYRFQGVPHDPDQYTQRFYAEITTRASGRLLELARGGREDDAVRLAAALHQSLALDEEPPSREELCALLAGDSAGALSAALFPAGPAGHELGNADSPFMARWRVFDDSAQDTASDLSVLVGYPAATEPATPGG